MGSVGLEKDEEWADEFEGSEGSGESRLEEFG